MLKILFIGDICGRIGRKAVIKLLPQIKKEERVDFVIANSENSAHGSGITESIIKELQEAGVDYMTMGDHAFKNVKNLDVYEKYPILRPANFSQDVPGEGCKIIEVNNKKILLPSNPKKARQMLKISPCRWRISNKFSNTFDI